MNDDTKLSALMMKFDTLEERAKKAAESLQGLIPVTGCPPEAQQAFLLTLSDLELLEQLCKTAQQTLNGFQLPVANDLDLPPTRIEMLVSQFGVSQDAVLLALETDFGRQIEMIETIVIRAEESLAAASAFLRTVST